jgi:hypothetical protein
LPAAGVVTTKAEHLDLPSHIRVDSVTNSKDWKTNYRVKRQTGNGKIMARMIKLYRIADDGKRVAAGAFPAVSERDLQAKWELHLATAAGGLYIATHRGVQLGKGLASDAVRQHGGMRG